jgi:GTPase SAR1 family protein
MLSSIIPLNIRLLGDNGVGKTNLIRRFRNIDFERRWIRTFGIEASPISIKTNYGTYLIRFYDTDGQLKYDPYNKQIETMPFMDATLLVYDHTSRLSANSLSHWASFCKKWNKDEDVMVIRAKSDITDSKVTIPSFVKKNPDLPHWSASTKNDDLKELLRCLLRQITAEPDLELMQNSLIVSEE